MKKSLLFFAACIVFSLAHGQGISTVAGNGYIDYSGNGDSAKYAQFYMPYTTAIDDSGNMYICDQGNNCVREVSVKTGLVTLFAGTTVAGFSGDNGPATAAKLNQPAGVATDAFGNVYISDKANSRIREVAKGTGIITTIAGKKYAGYSGNQGPADSAEINQPSGIVIDKVGNIYFADQANNRIRLISSGVISNIAGSGTAGDSAYTKVYPAIKAQFNKPAGIALDTNGNIYIADMGNNLIRKVDKSGNISTIAGNATSGFSGDGAQATTAQLNSPTGVGVDDSGKVYIADKNNNRLRMIGLNGNISTMAGNGMGNYAGNGVPATAAILNAPTSVMSMGNNLYVTDSRNDIIRKINVNDSIWSVAGDGIGGYSGNKGMATMASVRYPNGLAMDTAGNIYVADQINNVVRKVWKKNGMIVTVAGNGTPGYSGDGGSATAAGLNKPSGVFVDVTGHIYIADAGNNVVRKVDTTTGFISTIAGKDTAGYSGDGGQATAAELNNPYSVAVDASGNMYIADESNHRVRMVNGGSGIISTVAGNGTQGYTGDNKPATSVELSSPIGVAVDASGNFYIADEGQMMVRKVNSGGTIKTIAGNGYIGYSGDGGPATAAMLSYPVAITLDATGDIFVADRNNNVVRKIAAAGTISTVAGNGTAGYFGDNSGAATVAELNMPTGVAVNAAGEIFISDYNNHRIREVSNKFPTGVDNLDISTSAIKLFPNPNNGLFTIQLSENSSQKLVVEIYNMLGEKVYDKQLSGNNGQLTIDMNNRTTGVYLYRVVKENGEMLGEGKFILE